MDTPPKAAEARGQELAHSPLDRTCVYRFVKKTAHRTITMTSPKHRSTPVVILNCRRQGGLGIVRSLGRLGIPVWGIDANRFAAPFFSRYQKSGLYWDFDANSDADSLEFLY